MAHVGVLSVLEQAGIQVDFVAGTSVGSFMGALYCAGIPIPEMVEMAKDFRWHNLATPIWPRNGFVSFARLERWLTKVLGDIEFADLKIPLAVIATDMESEEQVVLKEGPLAPAVRASCSIPGIVSPVNLGGKLLGDGSLVNTLPTSTVREMGADYVIGVDIFRSTLRRHWGPFGFGFAALEILVRHVGGGIEDADCLISPELAGYTYLRVAKGAELIARGERAAQAVLPSLLRDLAFG
jgi:NTE family protein